MVGARYKEGKPPPRDTDRRLVRRLRGAPHTQPDVEARPMVEPARRVRPRPGRTCVATGVIAYAIRGAVKRPRRGDLEILRGQGWQPSPNGGPRDTDTCALQSTASTHRYLVTTSSYLPATFSIAEKEASQRND